MSSIGIGVTTYNRPDHIKLWQGQILKHAPVGSIVFIATDTPTRKGIAFLKNECLQKLKDCDYIFLFDDDTVVIKDGWAEYFIEAHRQSDQHHFLYLKETGTIKCIQKVRTATLVPGAEPIIINIYDNCGGCFMFLTKEVIEKVGGFNKNYGYYGFEHAGYSNRIHTAGLTPMGKYLCPAGASEYIYAMDYDFNLPFNKQVNHQPSMINEIEKIPSYIEQNRKVFLMDNEIYMPL